MTDYSTVQISQSLINEIVLSLKAVQQYGSIEIYVQNNTVTQITVRNIKKTSVSLNHTMHTPKKMRPGTPNVPSVHS